jgi:hypothetical protein
LARGTPPPNLLALGTPAPNPCWRILPQSLRVIHRSLTVRVRAPDRNHAGSVPRRADLDPIALDVLLRVNERVVTHAELIELGMPRSTITHRIRPGGPWQRVYPGVVVTHSGTITWRERLLGALQYAGPDAMITGEPGLRIHRVKVDRPKEPDLPHILIPHARRRTAHHLAIIERCRELPEPVMRLGLPVAPVAKCVADAGRRQAQPDRVRELVSACLQDRKCTVMELAAAVQHANRQRTALSREALREIDAGVRSVAESKVRKIVLATDLPEPLFNPVLRTLDGRFIASPDGYFPHCAAGYEIDSFAYHLRRKSYLETQRRLRRTARNGVLLIGISPVDAYEDPEGFVDELRQFIAFAEQRRLPHIVVESGPTAA